MTTKDAKDKLAQSRQAIVEHIARRQRRYDPREVPPRQAAGDPEGFDDEVPPYAPDEAPLPPPDGTGWLHRVQYAVQVWWRYHPAHMAVDLASPLLHDYARRKPLQLLAISAAAGAAFTFARPWKLISLTTLAVAVLKSSQLSNVVMAALSAADYRKDHDGPP